MITANTKLTALEILTECGVENPADKFGKVRVRIGGIAGINKPDYLINVPPEAKTIEVIVGADIFDLELAKGNKDNSADVPVISEAAREVLDTEGKEEAAKFDHRRAVKKLARRMQEAEDTKQDFTPTKQEEALVEEATEVVEAKKEARELQKERRQNREIKKVKSS